MLCRVVSPTPLLRGYPYGLFQSMFESLIPSDFANPRSKTTIPSQSTYPLSPSAVGFVPATEEHSIVSHTPPDCISTNLVCYIPS